MLKLTNISLFLILCVFSLSIEVWCLHKWYMWTVVRSLQSRMGLCYCPRTAITMTAPPISCSFAHWRRPFLFIKWYCYEFWIERNSMYIGKKRVDGDWVLYQFGNWSYNVNFSKTKYIINYKIRPIFISIGQRTYESYK